MKWRDVAGVLALALCWVLYGPFLIVEWLKERLNIDSPMAGSEAQGMAVQGVSPRQRVSG